MPARVAAVRPPWAIESGRITIEGSDFPIDAARVPAVHIGDAPARLVYASSTRLAVLVPQGLEGGRTPVRIDGISDAERFVEIAPPCATGLHQVDNPVFDRDGNLYVTF